MDLLAQAVESAEEVKKIVNARWYVDYGVLGLVLAAIIYGMRCVWQWFKPHGDRIVNAHIGLVDTLREESPKQTAAAEVTSEALKQLVAGKRGETSALHHITLAIDEIPECEDQRKAVKVHTENARRELK